MPHKGLTWFRLKEHIRKTFLIYVAGIIIMCVFTNLIFTMTRPTVPSEKEVLVYLVDSYSEADGADAGYIAANALEHGRQSDETLELVRFESIGYQGLEDYASPMLLTARMAVGDGDVYLCSPEAYDYASKAGMPVPLDDHLANGWLSELNPETIEWTNPETGETFIAGVSLKNLPQLYEVFRFDNEDAYLMMATNSTNLETAFDVVEDIIYSLMEGDIHAPADSEEPAA